MVRMSNPPAGGRKLLASNERIDPILAAGAPHDPVLAIRVGHILLDDVEALVASLPTRAVLDRLPPGRRVVEAQTVCDALDRATWQLDDAATLVHVAIAEARAA